MLRLNIKLKAYVYRQHLYTVRQRNGSTTTLLLNVSTQRNFVANFIRLNLNFIHKTTNSIFEPPFGEVRGNARIVHALYLYLVGKCVVNFLFAIIEHFSLDVIGRSMVSLYNIHIIR